jgi:hypothetical protein
MKARQTVDIEQGSEDCRTNAEDARDAATTSTAKGAATAAQADRRPNWRRWAYVPEVAVWEAVALSVDVDPEKVDWGGGAEGGIALSESPEFNDRLFIAVRNMGIGKLVPTVSIPGQNLPINATIKLAEFVAWARKLRWRLPAALVNIFGEEEGDYTPDYDSYWDSESRLGPRSVASRWPWGDYETRLLRLLAAAVDKHWTLFDPADPSTAPRNEMVVEWLMTTHDVKRRTAEVMATILRADGLPVGRRKE